MKNRFLKYLRKIGPGGIVLRMVLIWFVAAFLLYPNINLLISVFFKNGEFSTEVFSKLLNSKRAMRSLGNSFILAFTLVVTVNIVGILLVMFTEYLDIKGAKVLKLGYMSTLVYGGVVLATGYKFIYGSNGIITGLLLQVFPNMNPNWFTGYPAVVYLMTFACTSNHIIFLTNSIRGIDNQTIEAARNMGASFWRIFLKVVLPVLKPTLFAVSILTFLTGLGAMSAPLIVGGPEFQTINPMIITFAKSTFSREIAALLAVILGLATVLLLTILNRVESGGNYISISKVKSRITKQKITNPVANVVAHIVAYVLFIIYMLPIVLVILYSFTNSRAILSGTLSWDSFTLENYATLFTKASAFKPYLISIVYSGVAAIIVALIAIIVSRIVHKEKSLFSTGLEYSMLLPWLLPSTLIALGLMMTYDAPKWIMANKVLIGTPYILLFAYVIVKIPFSMRMIKAAFFSVEDSLEEAAKSMGASAIYTMRRVIVPVILPAVLSVIVLNFNSQLAEYDLTVFLYHPLLEPLGPVIKSASDETASANAQVMSFVYSVILMVVSTIALTLVYGKKPSFKRLRKN